MTKHYLMEFFNWWYTFLILVILIITAGVSIHLIQLNSFNQQAVKVIQRSGGVTDGAKTTLANISANSYMNMFEIVGDGKEVNYGGTVNYQIVSRIPFVKNNVISATSNYATVSQIRMGSQSYINN